MNFDRDARDLSGVDAAAVPRPRILSRTAPSGHC